MAASFISRYQSRKYFHFENNFHFELYNQIFLIQISKYCFYSNQLIWYTTCLINIMIKINNTNKRRYLNDKKLLNNLSPIQLLSLGYLIIILTGAFLLMLPISSTNGSSQNFIDAFLHLLLQFLQQV